MNNENFKLGILILILLFATLGSFAISMTSFLMRDEHMYIAASVLVAQGAELYKDFSYLQMPYLPIFLGNFYHFLGIESYYLIIGKLINWLFLLIASLVLFVLAKRVLNDRFLALGIATLFLLNVTIIGAAGAPGAAGFATNTIAPVTFALISFYLFYISFLENQIKYFGITVAGIFLALAIGTRLTYITVAIPFLAIMIYYFASRRDPASDIKRRIAVGLFCYTAGLTAGLLPVFLFMSDLDSFIFNNLKFHHANTEWRWMTDFEGPMSLYSKISFAHKQYFKSDNLILLFGIMCTFGMAFRKPQSFKQIFHQFPVSAYLAFFLVCITAITAVLPTPSWPHYYATPLSFLLILLIFSFSASSEITSNFQKRLMLILVLMMTASNGPHILLPIIRLANADNWTGLEVHNVSKNIRKTLLENDIDTKNKIATLFPIYAIETNLSIYPELSTGPFLYRVGDLLTAEQRKHYVGTSPESLHELLSKDPPAAIVIDSNEEKDMIPLNKPLIEFAVANNYRKVPIAGFSGEFYIMP
jgi:hypothetical protein